MRSLGPPLSEPGREMIQVTTPCFVLFLLLPAVPVTHFHGSGANGRILFLQREVRIGVTGVATTGMYTHTLCLEQQEKGTLGALR